MYRHYGSSDHLVWDLYDALFDYYYGSREAAYDRLFKVAAAVETRESKEKETEDGSEEHAAPPQTRKTKKETKHASGKRKQRPSIFSERYWRD